MKDFLSGLVLFAVFSAALCGWLIVVNVRLRRQLIERTRMQDEIHRLHSLERAEKKILVLLARNAPLKEILRAVARRVEKQERGLRCTVALYDDKKRVLELAAAPLLGREPEVTQQILLSNAHEADVEGFQEDVGRLIAERLNHASANKPKRSVLQLKDAVLVRDSRNQILGALYFYLPELVVADTGLDPDLIGRAQSLAAVAINLKRSQDKIYTLAHYDGLTDLPNRAFLQEYLHTALARGRRNKDKLAVFFLDLDGFKPVNDTYGHDMGDRVLEETARRLSASVRESDMVARLGGDEFVVVLEQIHAAEDAALVAQKILLALRQPFDLGGGVRVNLGSSIGVALFPDDGLDYNTLIKRADAAMYAAKEVGSRYCFYEDSSTIEG